MQHPPAPVRNWLVKAVGVERKRLCTECLYLSGERIVFCPVGKVSHPKAGGGGLVSMLSGKVKTTVMGLISLTCMS